MPKIDISAYGEVISVYDVNFSNEDMRFSILPEDFEVTTVQMDERHFRAVLTPNRILQFAQNETYTLTAVVSPENWTIPDVHVKLFAGFRRTN